MKDNKEVLLAAIAGTDGQALNYAAKRLRGYAEMVRAASHPYAIYVCMYRYIRTYTYYVLIRQRIPCITSARCKRLVNLRPAENLLLERGHPRVPPCNVTFPQNSYQLL